MPVYSKNTSPACHISSISYIISSIVLGIILYIVLCIVSFFVISHIILYIVLYIISSIVAFYISRLFYSVYQISCILCLIPSQFYISKLKSCLKSLSNWDHISNFKLCLISCLDFKPCFAISHTFNNTIKEIGYI